jgi:ATP-dependent protease HslVU (ClpYQ) peptidase subunit
VTTIAYDGRGQLASDSCWAWGNTQTTSMIKLRRLSSGALLGVAGSLDDRSVVALLDKVRAPDKMPSRAELAATRTDFQGLLVFPRGKVLVVCIEPVNEDGHHYDAEVFEVNRGPAAVGSGADFAMGAMAAGKTAREAVAIACKYDIHSRLPVHTMSLVRARAK